MVTFSSTSALTTSTLNQLHQTLTLANHLRTSRTLQSGTADTLDEAAADLANIIQAMTELRYELDTTLPLVDLEAAATSIVDSLRETKALLFRACRNTTSKAVLGELAEQVKELVERACEVRRSCEELEDAMDRGEECVEED